MAGIPQVLNQRELVELDQVAGFSARQLEAPTSGVPANAIEVCAYCGSKVGEPHFHWCKRRTSAVLGVSPIAPLVEALEVIEEILAELPMKEPAKKWYNWWELKVSTYLIEQGISVGPGVIRGYLVHPTKDVAETSAAECQEYNAKTAATAGLPPPVYLGAFPEGQRP